MLSSGDVSPLLRPYLIYLYNFCIKDQIYCQLSLHRQNGTILGVLLSFGPDSIFFGVITYFFNDASFSASVAPRRFVARITPFPSIRKLVGMDLI